MPFHFLIASLYLLFISSVVSCSRGCSSSWLSLGSLSQSNRITSLGVSFFREQGCTGRSRPTPCRCTPARVQAVALCRPSALLRLRARFFLLSCGVGSDDGVELIHRRWLQLVTELLEAHGELLTVGVRGRDAAAIHQHHHALNVVGGECRGVLAFACAVFAHVVAHVDGLSCQPRSPTRRATPPRHHRPRGSSPPWTIGHGQGHTRHLPLQLGQGAKDLPRL